MDDSETIDGFSCEADPQYDPYKTVACSCGWRGKLLACRSWFKPPPGALFVYYCPECHKAVLKNKWWVQPTA